MPSDTSTLESPNPLEQDDFLKFKEAEIARTKPAPVQPAAAKETPPDSPKAETKVEEPAGAPEAPKQDAQERKPTRKPDADRKSVV